MTLIFFFGFLIGVITIVFIECLGFILLLNRLNRKENSLVISSEKRANQLIEDLNSQRSPDLDHNKKGLIWILEFDKIRRDQKRKKEILEVTPVPKYATIEGQFLVLKESDGSDISIPLKGCIITAVSATLFSSRKWAKKYPIKVENKASKIYNHCRIFYIYLETSWEKESWCKCLRFASFDDNKNINRLIKLNEEFNSYMKSLNTYYPCFLKPFMGLYTEPVESAIKIDASSSKVRHFWKKLAKKSSKAASENKASWNYLAGREEKKISEKSCLLQEAASTHGNPRNASDTEADDRLGIDEGTLCWNLLISRLFFDFKSNMEMTKFLQAQIQRMLSNMRIPTYIGDVICTGLNIGNLAPYIQSMRVLPMDMNEVWAIEIDIEYSGGLELDIETRLEVHELDSQEVIGDSSLQSSSVREVTTDFLEGLEYYGSHLNLTDGTTDTLEQKDNIDPKQDGIENIKKTTPNQISRWKSILNSVAKQVSQVPISLGIKVASLKGTIQLRIKPPPSDQLWFGFTSMPDIDFNLESSVGEHKISTSRVAQFLINRFKVSIRDTIVLPNCETIFIPWMLGDKDDWVSQTIAPYLWVKQEAVTDPIISREETKIESSKGSTSDKTDIKPENTINAQFVQPMSKFSNMLASSSNFTANPPALNSKSLQEVKTPLLETLEPKEVCRQQSYGNDSTMTDKSNPCIEEVDGKPKRMGRKARMLDLGKKMSEKMGDKLGEKRRHIEEKSRHIVERMRGP